MMPATGKILAFRYSGNSADKIKLYKVGDYNVWQIRWIPQP